MSIRRVSQSTSRASDTLFPFLYYTGTIQKWSLRYSSGATGTETRHDSSLDGLDSKKEEVAEYEPVAQNQPPGGESRGIPDVAEDGTPRDKSAGRARILYPSLLMPHQRTEAAKRERAKQAVVDELNSVLSSDAPASDPRQYAPLHATPFETRSTTQRSAGSFVRKRRKRPDDIPFANRNIEGQSGAAEASSITPTELKVFERLFQARTPPKIVPQATPENAAESAKDKQQRGKPRLARPPPELPAPLVHLAKAAQQAPSQTAQSSGQTNPDMSGVETSMAFSKKATTSMSKWEKRLQAASTDHEYWRILAEQLDSSLRWLTHPDPFQQHPSVHVTAEVLPVALAKSAKTLRDRFPGSTLGLGVLPALKRLGPQAYASGCSTALYNVHMSILYRQYADILAVIDVLEEMDREVYPFDDETHALLDKILYDARGVQEGVMEHLSPAVSMLWSTERMRRAVREVEKWRDIVEHRRQNEALRLSRQKEELEEVDAEDAAQGWLSQEGEYLDVDVPPTMPTTEAAVATRSRGADA